MASKEDNAPWFIIAYVIPILTGILVLLLKGEDDRRMKLHSFQAIFLGAFLIVLSAIFDAIELVPALFTILSVFTTLILLLVWLYGLYVGLEAYRGEDITIPEITRLAKKYSGYGKAAAKAQK